MRDEKLEKIAAQYYDDRLHYHNFSHVDYVMSSARRIIESCKREGVAVDEAVVYYALLFHDAGFIDDHIALGYKSKEAWSAEIAARELKSHGLQPDLISRVRECILATHVDSVCVTSEAKAVRAADLSGLADEYRVFKNNAIDLMAEYELMSGNTIGWNEWKVMATDIIELYLRQDLHLTSDYYNDKGESHFHVNTRRNIERLLQDESDEPL